MKGNLFRNVPPDLPEEWVETLASSNAVRIERIVSRGQASPEDFWYDQDQNEFVLLLQGSAGLRMEGVEQAIVLNPGDYLEIPAHHKHRVDWTDAEHDTIWLCVFY